MPDSIETSEEQRSAIDMAEKVDTYRGFVRALSYVVMVHVVLAIPAAMYFFGGANVMLAAIIGIVLLAVGFFGLLKLFRSGARLDDEVPSPERRIVYTAPR